MLSILIILGGQKTYAALFIDKGNQSVAVDKTLQFLNEWKGTPLIIGSDGNKACIEPALFIGISYSGRWDSPTYMDFIKKIYPNSYLYTTYNDELIFWDHQTDISTILRTKNKALVYLSGSDSTVNTTILRRICGEQNQEPRIDYKKIYCSANHYENIYLVKVDSLR